MSLDLATLRKRLQQALGDEFRVGDVLGEGGFAAVFRARDLVRRRDVAVKVLDLGLTPSAELAERFVREARTVARLEHPGIVPIYKVGGYRNKVLYIVMRCVAGPSLRRLLEQRGRLAVADAALIARQVADALGYAHHEGVVHRDVKPDNILLDADGRVLVTDFGIAKATELASAAQLTTEGMVVGTPQYMSPEQATGDRVDTRSDIYSLGVVLYQMLAGVPPFDGESAQAILMKQATATPEPIRSLRGDVSRELADVVARALAKSPAERFPTAEDLSRALVAALPRAAGERVKLGRRPASAASGGVVGVVVALALAAVAWTLGSRPARFEATAPVSDSVNTSLRRRGILGRTDTALFAFIPTRGRDSVLFVIAERRVAVAAPRHLRGYPRDGLTYGFAAGWRRGPRLAFILFPDRGGRDTVFSDLSPRAAWQLARGVRGLLPAHRRPEAPAVRVETP